MKWGEPLFLKLLPAILVVLVILLIVAARDRRSRAARFAEPTLWEKIARSVPRGRRFFRDSLLLLALAAMLLAAARPQLGSRMVQVKRSGIDVILALDTSTSMDVTDVVPNRLGRSRRAMIDLIERLRGDRVGLVVFEGTAFLLCPLTLDYGAARLFLDSVETGMLPIPGSNLAEAVRSSLKAFPREGNRSRAIVVFSDGEARDPELESIAREARDAGVKIYTVGVGTPAGEPIPLKDDSGRTTGFKKDRAGQVVLSRLDETPLRQISEITGGAYFTGTLAGGEIEEIYQDLSGLTEKEVEAGLRTQYEERFQVFAGLAAVCLIGLFLLPMTGKKEEWHGRF
jgi:Ca-activated chloride channel family protein